MFRKVSSTLLSSSVSKNVISVRSVSSDAMKFAVVILRLPLVYLCSVSAYPRYYILKICCRYYPAVVYMMVQKSTKPLQFCLI